MNEKRRRRAVTVVESMPKVVGKPCRCRRSIFKIGRLEDRQQSDARARSQWPASRRDARSALRAALYQDAPDLFSERT